jgi:hypothetical protein
VVASRFLAFTQRLPPQRLPPQRLPQCLSQSPFVGSRSVQFVILLLQSLFCLLKHSRRSIPTSILSQSTFSFLTVSFLHLSTFFHPLSARLAQMLYLAMTGAWLLMRPAATCLHCFPTLVRQTLILVIFVPQFTLFIQVPLL